MSYPLEVKERAYFLFVDQRRTAEQIAEQLGIAVSTVKAWASTGEWIVDREEHQRDYLPLLRKAKLRYAQDMAAGSTQAAYAHERLKRSMAVRTTDLPVLLGAIEHAERRYAALAAPFGQVLLSYVESKPEDLQLTAAERRDLVSRVQALPEPTEASGQRKGITPETLKEIREQVYGIIDHAGN